MWEAYDLKNEDLLWSCIAFMGGIAGQQQAPCGALSASAVCLGLRNRCSFKDKPRAKQARIAIRDQAGDLVKCFTQEFGATSCLDLLGLDMSKPDEYQKFRESDIWKQRCAKYIEFIINRLYEYEQRPNITHSPCLEPSMNRKEHEKRCHP